MFFVFCVSFRFFIEQPQEFKGNHFLLCCFASGVLLDSEAWYILKGMPRLTILTCCKCKNEKEPDEHKYCSTCREYFREYHYKNRDKKNEPRKLNRQKMKNTTRHTDKKFTKMIKKMKNRKKYSKNFKQLEVFCNYCHCKGKKCRWPKDLQTKNHMHNETVENDENEKVDK